MHLYDFYATFEFIDMTWDHFGFGRYQSSDRPFKPSDKKRPPRTLWINDTTIFDFYTLQLLLHARLV